jgi:hypothetical protein
VADVRFSTIQRSGKDRDMLLYGYGEPVLWGDLDRFLRNAAQHYPTGTPAKQFLAELAEYLYEWLGEVGQENCRHVDDPVDFNFNGTPVSR